MLSELTINKNQVIDVLDQYLHSISMINDDQKLKNFHEGVVGIHLQITGGVTDNHND